LRVLRATACAATVACALAARPAAALDPRRSISQYGLDLWEIEDGLPSATVRCMLQTRDGYLWLGTLSGLVRFDGVHFTVFDRSNTPQMRDHLITSLFEDRAGTLWIGTDGGLHSFRAGRFAAHGASEHERSLHVVGIGEAKDGLWVAAQQDELYRVKDGVVSPASFGSPFGEPQAFHVDPSGRLWLGSQASGVAAIRDGVVETYASSGREIGRDVRAFANGRDGAVWIGSDTGVTRVARDGTLQHHPLPSLVRALVEDRDGSLWIGFTESGIARLREGRLEHYSKAQGLASPTVRALYEDREGSIWIGAGDGGLNRLRGGAFATIGAPEGLSGDIVIALYVDAEDRVWAGTKGGLSVVAAGRAETVATRRPLSGTSIVSVARDRAGVVWAGTSAFGLNRIERGDVRVFRAGDGLGDDDVFALLPARDGTLWVGLRGGGLARLSGTTFERFGKDQGLASQYVWDLLEAPTGTLWLATAQGVYSMTDGAFRRVIPEIPAHSLHLDADGVLWIGTARRGLYRLKDGAFSIFTTADGLQDDNVTQVLEDGAGNLWLGSSRGISRISKRELEDHAAGRRRGVTALAYDGADGLRSRECNYGRGGRTSDGRLWFPTIRGIAVVDPHDIAPNAVVPPVHVERVVADGRLLARAPDGPAVVPPGQGRVEFAFTALSLLAPQKVRFAYRLDGFDADWSAPSAERAATYTNLPPGRYVFRVKASNNDGLWNETGDAFPFVLRPHFHQTVWFYGLCALAVAAVVWRVHLYRTHRLVEMERVRTRIAADLHDDIGSGLSQIAVLSEVVRQQARASGGPDSQALARISGTAGELVDSMSDIVWAVNPARDRMQDLTQRMRGFASEVAEARGLDLRFHADALDQGGRLDPDVRRHVYLIFKESVNNAACHSGGTVLDVSVEVVSGRLHLRVRDDGRGFAGVGGGDGNGLGTIARRAAELGGRADVTSAPGEGTTVSLDVPLARRRARPGAI
jgi:ligand-binding sensor domain-containing protein/signal transduction histidine kinase